MVDEMFDGPGGQMDVVDSEDSVMTGPASSLLSELTANERTVHADFYNNFGDLFDDKDLNWAYCTSWKSNKLIETDTQIILWYYGLVECEWISNRPSI